MKKKMTRFLLVVMMVCAACTAAYADRIGSNTPNPPANNGYGRAYVTVPTVPVYCFYSAFMRDYMYTASETERAQLTENYLTGKETYQYQSVCGYAEDSAKDWNKPVYRFWNKKTMDHFYTADEEEKKQVERDLKEGKDNYVYEGIAWYVPEWSERPVYRFYDTAAFNHYYTDDAEIKESLNHDYLAGTGTYRYEGIAWYWY